MLFWESLGIVSVFLILFNIRRAKLRGGLVTLATSRLGDAALFVIVAGSHLVFSDWPFDWYVITFLMVIVTKSAFLPASSWLPEAMRAPTPVSSLVHSSTLVAAGLWFLYRYMEESNNMVVWHCLLTLSIVTAFTRAIFALAFDDIKKVIAFSTCNNISWCVIILLLGCAELSVIQFMVHGVCKCLLFLFIGDHIIDSSGRQRRQHKFSLSY